MENTIQSAPAQQKKHVSNQEFVLFLISVFFYTNMTGMVNGYRQAYLVNVLRLDSGSVSLINAICGILGFALSFFYAIIMDNRKKSKLGKLPSTWPCVGGADGHFNRDDVCHAPNAASYHDRLSLHGAAASGRGILFWKQREYGWRCDDA